MARPIVGGGRDLQRYLRTIGRFPILEADQEARLARRVRAHNDAAAAQTLVTSHLRLVAKIAMSYRGYGLPMDDLISEGTIGMMQAVQRFDPERGFRLATYAMWWIRASIQDYILRSWSLVRMGTTRAQKKLFFNLRKLKSQLQAIDDGELAPDTVRQIATALGVPEAEVVSMNRRLAGPDHSLNTPLSEDGEGEWQDRLVDGADSQEIGFVERESLDERRRLVHDAMRGLNARERSILAERRLQDRPSTLEDLSERYHISRERVRQIEMSALAKLHRAVRKTRIVTSVTGTGKPSSLQLDIVPA